MDSDLSPQDKKDLDKFIKFFALKVIILNTTVLKYYCMHEIWYPMWQVDDILCFMCVFKTVQVIVQARLGEKVSTCSSSSPTGSDWVRHIQDTSHTMVLFCLHHN